MLGDYFIKVKPWIGENKSDLYIAGIIFLVSLASFGLGRLSILWPEKEPVRITNNQDVITATADSGEGRVETASVVPALRGKYVASQNGTAYHFPWCPGATRIKEENKIWFDTKEEAEGRGYRPAANCEGLDQ